MNKKRCCLSHVVNSAEQPSYYGRLNCALVEYSRLKRCLFVGLLREKKAMKNEGVAFYIAQSQEHHVHFLVAKWWQKRQANNPLSHRINHVPSSLYTWSLQPPPFFINPTMSDNSESITSTLENSIDDLPEEEEISQENADSAHVILVSLVPSFKKIPLKQSKTILGRSAGSHTKRGVKRDSRYAVCAELGFNHQERPSISCSS